MDRGRLPYEKFTPVLWCHHLEEKEIAFEVLHQQEVHPTHQMLETRSEDHMKQKVYSPLEVLVLAQQIKISVRLLEKLRSSKTPSTTERRLK